MTERSLSMSVSTRHFKRKNYIQTITYINHNIHNTCRREHETFL